ncbi:MAG: peptide deformylase [Candidatus Adiutrix sp.]|jgi:peptide deformylase|nr:peptide deformylase [Candidatus Adiutrix sp.]
MPVRPILKYPDARLREKSAPVTAFDQDLRDLARDLAETMLSAPGAGLAAPQVGVTSRLIVVAGAENDEEFDDRVLVLVNPRLTRAEGEQFYNEGCLSVRDLQEKVTRSAEVTVAFQDLEGQPRELEADGRRAVILQHEIDHLDGVLFLDHLSRLKREIYQRRLRKLRKEEGDD